MRNLGIRTLIAVIGAPLLLWICSKPSMYLNGLISVIQIVMMWEWKKLNLSRGVDLSYLALIATLVVVDSCIFFSDHSWSVGISLLAVVLILLNELRDKRHNPLVNLGLITLFLLYAVLPLALWSRFHVAPGSSRFSPVSALPTLLVTTWICDTFAYFTGSIIGKHKLYPAASPNKTVEGFFGGLVGAAIVMPIFNLLGWSHANGWDFIVAALIVGIIGQCGDLLESLMKREAGVKDTSALLPGHGGFFDRFDSLLLSTPCFFAYLTMFN
jgi:phosphatidate cytidylyltransferase